MSWEAHIAGAPDARTAALRMERMLQDREVAPHLEALPEAQRGHLVLLVSISNFLFHYLCRKPEVIDLSGTAPDPGGAIAGDLEALRAYKYRELYKIAWLDITATQPYESVLLALSKLAETILRSCVALVGAGTDAWIWQEALCILALGKLGACELNFSSDIDLVFISANQSRAGMHIGTFQTHLQDGVRGLSRSLEERTAGGFLYRVDLNLRPWGRSGPLFMALDDAEHYYEASSDAWERYAWLRARPVAGAASLGQELLARLRPFVFLRSLSTQDLDRFVGIKRDMNQARQRRGHWDVKTGDGGIRDIEFFVQTMQIVNAARHECLRTTNTLDALAGLGGAGLISRAEEQSLRRTYLFLRRLENRLQMADEQQTHELPDDPARRRIVARSLAAADVPDGEAVDDFETELALARSVAANFFNRILPATGT